MAQRPDITSPDYIVGNGQSVLDFNTSSTPSNDWREALVKSIEKNRQQVIQQSEKNAAASMQKALALVNNRRRNEERQARDMQAAQQKEQQQIQKTLSKIKTANDLPGNFLAQIPTFDTAKPSEFDQMGFKEQTEVYNKYVMDLIPPIRAALGDAPIADTEIRKALNKLNEPYKPIEPTRDFGAISTTGDVLAGVGSSLSRMVGGVANLAIPKVGAQINEYATQLAEGIEGLQSDVVKDARKSSQYQTEKAKQEYLESHGEDMGVFDSALTEFKSYKDNFSAGDLGALIGNIGASLVGGGAAAKSAQAASKLTGLAKVSAKAPMLKKAGNTLSFAAGSAVFPAGEAGSVSTQHVMQLPLEELVKSPLFQQALAENDGDEEAARWEVANKVGRQVTGSNVILGTIFNAVPGSWGSRFMNPASSKVKQKLLRKVGDVAGASAIAATDAATEQFAQNWYLNQVDPNWELTIGIGQSVALGGLLGGVLGGAAHTKTGQKVNIGKVREDAARAVATDMGLRDVNIKASDKDIVVSGIDDNGNTVVFDTDGTITNSRVVTPEGELVSHAKSDINENGDVMQVVDRGGVKVEQSDHMDDTGVVTRVKTSEGSEFISKTYLDLVEATDSDIVITEPTIRDIKIEKNDSGVQRITKIYEDQTVVTFERFGSDDGQLLFREVVEPTTTEGATPRSVYKDLEGVIEDPQLIQLINEETPAVHSDTLEGLAIKDLKNNETQEQLAESREKTLNETSKKEENEVKIEKVEGLESQLETLKKNNPNAKAGTAIKKTINRFENQIKDAKRQQAKPKEKDTSVEKKQGAKQNPSKIAKTQEQKRLDPADMVSDEALQQEQFKKAVEEKHLRLAEAEKLEKKVNKIRQDLRKLDRKPANAKRIGQLNKEIASYEKKILKLYSLGKYEKDLPVAADSFGKPAKSVKGDIIRSIETDLTLSPEVRNAASTIRRGYDMMGKPLPKVEYRSDIFGDPNALGAYFPNENVIHVKPDSSIHAVLHEFAHGLTLDGIRRMQAISAGKLKGFSTSEVQAAADITNINRKIIEAISKTDNQFTKDLNKYGLSSAEELFAEFASNPKYRAAAESIELPISYFNRGEQKALKAMGVKFYPDLKKNLVARAAQIVARSIRNILNTVFEGAVPKKNIADIMDILQNRYGEMDRHAKAKKIYQKLESVTQDTPALLLADPEKAGKPNEFIADLLNNNGKIKTFEHTANEKFLRSLYKDVKSGSNIMTALQKQFQDKAYGDKITTALFDSLHPMVVEFDKLAKKHPHVKPQLDEMITGFRTMRDKANLFRSKLEPHQDAIMKIVTDGAKEMNVDAETAMSTMGYYLTAKHHKAAYDNAIRNLDNAIQRADDKVQSTTGAERATALSEWQKLTSDKVKFEAAYNDPDINAPREIEQPAGMSKAQADAMLTSTSSAIPDHIKPKLEAAVKRLVADQLLLEVEAKMVSPKTVARFLNNPNLEAELDNFLNLKRSRYNDLSDANRQAYENEFKKVSKMLENDYVPYSTYLTETIGGDNLLPTQDNILRSSETQKIMGSKIIPADGLSGLFANVVKSANRYGQRTLLSNLVELYKRLDFAGDLQSIGLAKIELTAQNMAALQIGKTSGILVPGKGDTPSAVYAFNNPVINGALNKVLQAELPGNGIATKILRSLVGSMTTYNPLFHTTQYFRNRKELLDAAYFRIGELGVDIKSQWKEIENEVTRSMWFGKTLSDTVKSVFRGQKSTIMKDMLDYSAVSAKYADIFDVRRGPDIAKRINKIKSPVRRKMAAIGSFLENMNHVTDIAPKAALFEALVKRGVSKEKAALYVRDIADFGKSGDYAKTSYGKSIAFFKPAFVGLDSIRKGVLSKDPNTRKRAYGRFLKRVLFYTAVESAYRMVVGDDDTRSDYAKVAYTHLPMGDTIIKLPVAYGLSRVAKSLVGVMLDTADPDKPMSESIAEALSNGVMSNFSPIDAPDISFTEHPLTAIAATIAPTIIEPVVYGLANINSYGQNISRGKQFWEKDVPYYQLTQGEMAAEYTNISRWMFDTFGLDYDPAYIKFFTESFTPGILGEMRRAIIDNPNLVETGRSKTVKGPMFEYVPLDAKTRTLYYSNFDRARKIAEAITLKGPDYIPTARENDILATYESLRKAYNDLTSQAKKDMKAAETQAEAKEIKRMLAEAEYEFMKDAISQFRMVLKR